ncbi:MAG: hypothetical protein CM15mP62_15670 [Rhodospirillaceae bacterium]|nr:MAG: hypothetical protein CM15mP62_15670 [Rhodospirillaceae bacterium]
MSVDFGKWKFVISASVALNLNPGVINKSVSPANGFIVPPIDAVSKTRRLVVPSAITLLPLAFTF